MSDSDSDSDFGDFTGDAQSDLSTSAPVSLEQLLDSALGESETIPYKSSPHSLRELIQDERPKVVYEHLVLVDTQLRPFSWRHSKLRSLLLQTLRIPDEPPAPKVRAPRDTALYAKLEPHLNEVDANYADILSVALDGQFTANAESRPSHLPQALQDYKNLELDKLDASALQAVHDELAYQILGVCQDIAKSNALRTQLESDKATFEAVVTNLAGHTQRVRRDEIAQFNKKNRRTSRYGKFKWTK